MPAAAEQPLAAMARRAKAGGQLAHAPRPDVAAKMGSRAAASSLTPPRNGQNAPDARPAFKEPSMPPRVGLFATCLMNLFRPNVGFAAVKLLENAGCRVEVPQNQTCCGQPAYNSGDFEATRALARQVIEVFEGFDYVVGPSGSCMATIRKDYPRLFADDPPWRARAEALAAKSFELISFLTDVRGQQSVDAAYPGSASYPRGTRGPTMARMLVKDGKILSTKFIDLE